jgi:DNA adenine methylase
VIPPIKCQGIKTKLVSSIKSLADNQNFDRWIEPFCGSGVVAFNLQPKKALLADANIHIINFYNDLKTQQINPNLVKEFLEENGNLLQEKGAEYYYQVRTRFNAYPNSLDFLFLNRSCFNGVMRFNQQGKFNVPYCKKDQRFSKSYITKIVNQVTAVTKIIYNSDWTFAVADFRDTISLARENDLIYLDPPYSGRHVDYFNSWSEFDETSLIEQLKNLHCKFILSTWYSNQFRTNPAIEKDWKESPFNIHTQQHFYHVGSTENLRHPMIEALITNFPNTPNSFNQDNLHLSCQS